MNHPEWEDRNIIYLFLKSETFLDHIIQIYRRFKVKEIVLVVNESFDLGAFHQDDKIKIVINDNLEFGRFYSIQLGLQKLTGQNVFIQNIDNPFVNLGLLRNMQYGLGRCKLCCSGLRRKSRASSVIVF